MGRENFLARFELYRILSVSICDVDSSIAIAESSWYSKSVIMIKNFILLA